MKEKTSAGAAKIEQAECNQARLRLLRRSLFYLKNLSKKLHRNDILRKFAFGKAVVRDCLQTLRIEMTSVTLPFDSRKSRKLKRISQRIASDVHALYMAWAAPAVLLIRVVREPTWAKCRRVCPRLLFLLIAIMPMAAVSQNSRQTESTTYKLKNSKTYHKLKNSKTQKLNIILCHRSSKQAEASSQAESSSASTQATTPLRCPPTAAVPGLRVARTLPTAPSATCSL